MRSLQPEDGATHAREFWVKRYQNFSLSESGWLGAGELYNEYIYACKRQALRYALRRAGIVRDTAIDVLDAGCGQGFFAGTWQNDFPAARYNGVDICEKLVKHLKNKFPDQHFFVGDLADWKHPAGKKFDIIHSFEVMHLFLSDAMVERAVVNLAEQLKPGGHLLLTAALPETTVEPNEYIRHQSRHFFSEVFARAGLVLESTNSIYYWLPDGGPNNRVVSKLLRLPGPWLMYALDRIGHSLHLTQWFGGWDSRTKLLTLTKLKGQK